MMAGLTYIWRAAVADSLTSSPPMWTCSLGKSSRTSFKTVSRKLKVPSFPCVRNGTSQSMIKNTAWTAGTILASSLDISRVTKIFCMDLLLHAMRSSKG